MQKTAESSLRRLYPILFQASIGLTILFLSGIVINSLPMVGEVKLPFHFSFPELISATILTLLVVLLTTTAKRIELRLHSMPDIPSHLGLIIKLAVYTISALISYYAFLPILPPYLGHLEWLYSFLFLSVFILLLAFFCYTTYYETESLLYFFRSGTKTAAAISNEASFHCPHCKKTLIAGSRFCASCGFSATAKQREADFSLCQGCGVALKPRARFCTFCGQAVVSGADTDTNTETPKKEKIIK